LDFHQLLLAGLPAHRLLDFLARPSRIPLYGALSVKRYSQRFVLFLCSA
jgi:hypothetical protein